jgi:hypothetical protein
MKFKAGKFMRQRELLRTQEPSKKQASIHEPVLDEPPALLRFDAAAAYP